MPAPPNDSCATAIPISTLPYTQTVDITLAADSVGLPVAPLYFYTESSGTFNQTVWYALTVPAGVHQITIDTIGSDYDNLIAVWTGSCGALTFLTGKDAGNQEAHGVEVTPGATYLIMISGFGGPGTLVLSITQSPTQPSTGLVFVPATTGTVGQPTFGSYFVTHDSTTGAQLQRKCPAIPGGAGLLFPGVATLPSANRVMYQCGFGRPLDGPNNSVVIATQNLEVISRTLLPDGGPGFYLSNEVGLCASLTYFYALSVIITQVGITLTWVTKLHRIDPATGVVLQTWDFPSPFLGTNGPSNVFGYQYITMGVDPTDAIAYLTTNANINGLPGIPLMQSIHRFDLNAGVFLADLVTLGNPAIFGLGLVVLPTGELIATDVANYAVGVPLNIRQRSTVDGSVVRTLDSLPNAFALAPGITPGTVWYFAAGAVRRWQVSDGSLLSSFSVPETTNIWGVYESFSAVADSLTLAPSAVTNPAGARFSQLLTATAIKNGAPLVGAQVSFTAQTGPNKGVLGVKPTNASGVATLTLTDTFGAGVDTVVASAEFSPPPPTPPPGFSLTSVSPAVRGVGDPDFTLQATGRGFVPASVVRLDGSDRATTYGSATALTAAIPASDQLSAGTRFITVYNPATPATTNAKTLTVGGSIGPSNPGSPPTGAGAIYASGMALKHLSDGSDYFGIGVTVFTLLQDWLNGGPGAVDPFLDWMQAHGIEFARVLGMYWDGIGFFDPQTYGSDYFSGAAALVDHMAARGLRLKLSLFADAQNSPLTNIHQASFFAQMASALAGKGYAWLDGGNEYDKNGFNPQNFAWPDDLMCGRGSGTGDLLPPINPFWEFEFHPSRNDEWPRKGRAILDIQEGNTSEGIALPIPGGMDEPIGIGEDNEGGRTTANADDMFDFMANPFGSYIVLHVRAFITQSNPNAIGPIAQRVVEAGVAGGSIIPPQFRSGNAGFTHDGFGNFVLQQSPIPGGDPGSWWLRANARILGSEAWCTIVRPRFDNGLVVEGNNGWNIEGRYGPRGSVVHLTR